MIGVFVATRMESAGLRKRLSVEESVRERGFVVERGKCEGVEILLVQTGMGRARAEAAAAKVLSRWPLEAVVSLGLSGALVPWLRVGEIVLCAAIRHGDDGPVQCDPDLLSKAMGSSKPAAKGIAVTSEEFVSTVEAKREMAWASEAIAVDMESYWIGKAAVERGLPFLSIRAISDSLTVRLPPMDRFIDGDGGWRRRSVAVAFATRPRTVVEFLSLGRNARRAARNLTAYFIDVLPLVSGISPPATESSRALGPVLEGR
jgi:adenosylhomocysteine nucleosidase